MSVASRKCGVHMLHPPTLVTTTTSTSMRNSESSVEKKATSTTTTTTTTLTMDATLMLDSSTAKTSTMTAVQRRKSSDKICSPSYVETFLDENSDFLEDYVRRKVNRVKLENWLFRRHSTTSSKQFLSPDFSNAVTLSSQRQRSRSFTPLRKLSATKFEESGLSTPILSKTVDGQPTFLRTQPPPMTSSSTSDGNTYYDVTNDCCRDDRNVSRKISDKRELLLQLIPEMVAATDVGTWCYKVARALKKLFRADRTELLILSRPNTFDGDLFVMNDTNDDDDGGGDRMTKVRCSTNRLVTGSITSGRILNVERPDIEVGNFVVESALVGPLFCSRNQRIIASVHLYKKTPDFEEKTFVIRDNVNENDDDVDDKSSNCVEQKSRSSVFSLEEEILFGHLLDFAGRSLTSVQANQEMRLELSRSEVFLELARTVFREPSRLEPTMLTILMNFLSLIDCERCQILLSDPDHSNVFKRVFDLERKDLNVDGSCDRDAPFEARFPINAFITGEVARTGKKISLKFEKDDERSTGPSSILCMPIRDPDDKVLGVISLIDKESDGGFTDNDARFAEAFSIFCGMAIRNAADYEKAVLSEAKLQVAFEVMNRFMTSTEHEAVHLSNLPVASANSSSIDTFTFDYLSMSDNDTLTSTIRMFIDLGLLSRFSIDYLTLCRFLLTVKRNYRNETVKYHNWYHAFNVAQMMFSMLLKTGWNKFFTETDVLGLLVACVCHDLDHRGTNNSFQIKTQNPLAKLYSSSTMERHHLNQCLLLLNLKGNNILEHLNKDQYTTTLTVIESCILATDLSLHFRHLPEMSKLANLAPNIVIDSVVFGNDAKAAHNRFILQSAMMTAADLGAVTKPWVVHRHVSQLLAEEFWAQGDLERQELNEDPQPMMDRHASLSSVQLGFIDGVCTEIYQIMTKFSPLLQPLLDGCLANRTRWVQLEEEEQKTPEVAKARNL